MPDIKEEVKKDKVAQERKRIPLGTRNVLTAPKRDGFVRRFVNDKGDRVQRFKDAGYSIVGDDIQVGDPKIGRPEQLGSNVSVPLSGGNQRAVLMEIPENHYKEDYAAAQNKITEQENEMKRNSMSQGQDGLVGKVAF
jgi:hypothetical protein